MSNEHETRAFCGWRHTFLLKKDGSLFGFGGNELGELSLPENDEQCYLTPTFVLKMEKISNLFCGNKTSFLLMEDGNLHACGDNLHWQLGIERDESVPKFEFIMADVKQVFVDEGSTTVLTLNRELFIFGELACKQILGQSENLEKKLQVGESVVLLPENELITPKWTFEGHKEFDEQFQDSVLCFLLCMKKKIAKHLMFPKPIFSMIINFSISLADPKEMESQPNKKRKRN